MQNHIQLSKARPYANLRNYPEKLHGRSVLTASGEVHGVRDGVVAVDGKRDQHVRRRVRHHRLQEPYYLAERVPRVPRHCDPPDDVRRHADQPHGEICVQVTQIRGEGVRSSLRSARERVRGSAPRVLGCTNESRRAFMQTPRNGGAALAPDLIQSGLYCRRQ